MYKRFKMDAFVMRQFSGEQGHLPILCKPEEIADYCNNHQVELKEGYAPFCKHIFIENFTKTPSYYQEITPENAKLIECGYEARTEKELPVLRRYFPKEKVQQQVATYLDIILYSRDQIIEENKAMGVEHTNGEYEWGIISIKPQMCGSEIKMDPITMMRNALGKDEGGSGVKLNREEYKMSADFWNKNAIIK